jgi:hypothetical protein
MDEDESGDSARSSTDPLVRSREIRARAAQLVERARLLRATSDELCRDAADLRTYVIGVSSRTGLPGRISRG